MSFYADHIVPLMIELAMRNREIARRRPEIVAQAAGRVLELGVGSGFNLPLYRDVVGVVGIDPSGRLIELARRRGADAAVPIELYEISAETLPFADASFDTVLSTCTLCSIADLPRALAEARRVLRPGGRFAFLEHGRGPTPGLQRWQDRLDPLWTRIAGGCHINRPIDRFLTAAGFTIERMRNEFIRGPRTHAYLYVGAARPT